MCNGFLKTSRVTKKVKKRSNKIIVCYRHCDIVFVWSGVMGHLRFPKRLISKQWSGVGGYRGPREARSINGAAADKPAHAAARAHRTSAAGDTSIIPWRVLTAKLDHFFIPFLTTFFKPVQRPRAVFYVLFSHVITCITEQPLNYPKPLATPQPGIPIKKPPAPLLNYASLTFS